MCRQGSLPGPQEWASYLFSRTQLLPLALSLKCLGENKGLVLFHLNKHQVPSSGAHLSPTSGWGGHILQLYTKLNDAFELWCWRRLLRVPWMTRRSNQSILKEISPEYSLEGLLLKLKLQYFGHLLWRTDSLEKPLMLGMIEVRCRRGS